VGYQAECGPKHVLDSFLAMAAVSDTFPIDSMLFRQQVVKEPDEVDCMRASIHAAEEAFLRAQSYIQPGVRELEVLAECYRAAIMRMGRPRPFVGEFRCGEKGGPARDRVIQAGEVYIVEIQCDAAGYWCDLSRSFVVGGEPTDLQMSVYQHLANILMEVPSMVVPGVSCLHFWKQLDSKMRWHPRLSAVGLARNGGHGIGLRVHESPDISPHRDGTFEVGNTFTVQPAIYLPELRSGIRLENNYYISETRVELLSASPISFLPTNVNPKRREALTPATSVK
jgi:Xaa-Pro aminopeptidase